MWGMLMEKENMSIRRDGGVASLTEMYKIMEYLINNEKRECALRMLADRELPLEKIAKYSDLTLEQIKELS